MPLPPAGIQQHAAVAATTGILRILSEDELAGVMAHELAHVKNRDILISTIAATFAGAVSMLANFGFLFAAVTATVLWVPWAASCFSSWRHLRL